MKVCGWVLFKLFLVLFDLVEFLTFPRAFLSHNCAQQNKSGEKQVMFFQSSGALSMRAQSETQSHPKHS
jgi:hypothetical protein